MKTKILFYVTVAAFLIMSPKVIFAVNPGHDAGGTGQKPISSHEVITITHSYDELGRLTGQRQHIVTTGTNIDAGGYTTTTDVSFEIIGGLAKMKASTSTTDTGWDDGSKSHEVTTTNYQYDAGGRLTGASGKRTLEGNDAEYKDEKGNTVPAQKYTGNFDLTYQVISGQAAVMKSDGTTNTSIRNEDTGNYDSQSSAHTVTTYSYAMIAGALKTTQVKTSTDTTSTEGDGHSGKQTNHEDITIKYTYNSSGELTAASGSGSGYGSQLTGDGYMSYTETIAIEFEIKNGVAKEKKRTITKDSAPLQAPANGDPAIQGEIVNAYLTMSGENSTGVRDYAVDIIVKGRAYDETKGDGQYQTLDGDSYYIVRIFIPHSGDNPGRETQARNLVSQYVSQVGQNLLCFGDKINGSDRAIIFKGLGNGGFDIP